MLDFPGRIIEAADTCGIPPSREMMGTSGLALTIEWNDGKETLEFVSEKLARMLGYSYDGEDHGPQDAQPAAPSRNDLRPPNCRNVLREEGKPHPKSGCDYCKTGGLTGCPWGKSGAELRAV